MPGLARLLGSGVAVTALAFVSLAMGPADAFAVRWAEFAPPPVSGLSVYDTQRDRVLVFGNDAIWSASGDPVPVWSKIYLGPRLNASGYIYQPLNDRVWAFRLNLGHGALGQLWSMDLGTLPLAWVERAYTGESPSRGGGGVAHVYDPIRQRIVFFGGNVGCIGCTVNEVFTLDLTGTPSWNIASVQGTLPTGRTQAAGVYDPVRDRMIFYGGLNLGPTYYDESWALSMGPVTSWTFMTPQCCVALARVPMIAVVDSVRQRMIVHGGTGPSGDYADTWALDLSLSSPANTANWSAVAAGVTDTRPPLRTSAIAWVSPQDSRMYRYGGSFGGAPRIDLWALDLGVVPTWSALRPDSLRPPQHSGYAAFLDPSNQHWNLTLGTQTWSRMEGAEQPWTVDATNGPSGQNSSGAVSDVLGSRTLLYRGVWGVPNTSDLWAYPFGGSTWTLLTPPTSPPWRERPLVLMDTARRRLMVHGGSYVSGFTTRPRTDTWSYDVASNTWSELPAGGPGRWGEAGIYDPVRDRFIAFGGTDTVTSWTDVRVLPAGGGTWSPLATAGFPPVIWQPGSVRAAYNSGSDRMIVIASDATNLVVYALSLGATPTWSVVPVNDTPPRRREGYAFAADPTGSRMLISGGTNPSYDDTWELYIDYLLSEGTVVAPPAKLLSLAGARPNPVSGPMRVTFSLAGSEPARLELLDVMGRRLVSREVGGLGPGSHSLVLSAADRPIGTGLYFLRLTQGNESRLARAIVIH